MERIEDDINIQNYMITIIQRINSDINTNLPSSSNEFHLYTRYNKTALTFKIFVNINLNPNTPPKKGEEPIYFLITITSSYPQAPPMLQCISPNALPSLSDCRDFRHCLIPEWNQNEKVTTLIKLLPNFIRNVQNDIDNGILIYYGQYFPKTLLYPVNDFTMNPRNFLKKAQTVIQSNPNKKPIIVDRFIIITDLYFIILSPCDTQYKNLCNMKFYGELMSINSFKKTELDNVNNSNNENIIDSNKEAYKIEWKKDAKRIYDNIIIIDKAAEFIEVFTSKINNLVNYNYIFSNKKRDKNNIPQILEKIKSKEEFLDKHYDYFAFKYINEMYNSIIEICSNKNEFDNIPIYLNQMQELFKKHGTK